MPTQIYKDALVMINAVNLSAACKSATLNIGAETGDDTAFADNTRSAMSGLKTWSMEFEFHQDFAAAQVDATLNGLVGGAAVTVALRPTSAAKSATNPEYTGSAICTSYIPMSGAVGTVPLGARATFVAAGDLTRATA